MSIFPFVQPEAYQNPGEALPLYTDVKWDFDRMAPVYVGGEPVITTGAEAVLGWAARALLTPRFISPAYSWGYGNETYLLIGKQWSPETKTAEAARYVRDCLMQSPYITSVPEIAVDFENGTLYVRAKIETVYGSGKLEVTRNV